MVKRSTSKISRADLKRAIDADGGIVSKMATRFGVTRQTIYNRLDETGLRDEIGRARKTLYDMAVDNVVAWLDAGDPIMTRFVLTHYPGGDRWSSKAELQVTGITVSEETLKLLERMGISADDVASEFEALIQNIAKEQHAHE